MNDDETVGISLAQEHQQGLTFGVEFSINDFSQRSLLRPTSFTLKVGLEAGIGAGTPIVGGANVGTTSESFHLLDLFNKR
ncbi:MAG: hypothetical protein K2Q24_16650 [Chitinophagaceae bacterium]|nr:hypothetical protein [Chitinophagaceae bacterium]